MPRIIETVGGQKEDESEQAGGGVTWTICIFKFEFFFSAPVAPQIFHTLSAFSPAICLSLSEDWALALPDGLVFSVLFLSSIPLVLTLSLFFLFSFSLLYSIYLFVYSISLFLKYTFFCSLSLYIWKYRKGFYLFFIYIYIYIYIHLQYLGSFCLQLNFLSFLFFYSFSLLSIGLVFSISLSYFSVSMFLKYMLFFSSLLLYSFKTKIFLLKTLLVKFSLCLDFHILCLT